MIFLPIASCPMGNLTTGFVVPSFNVSCPSPTPKSETTVLWNLVIFKLPKGQSENENENLIAPIQFPIAQGNLVDGVVKLWWFS